MLTVLLKILSILGILLLVVLGVVLTIILLVLFFPITYRLEAARKPADGTGAGGMSGTGENDETAEEPGFWNTVKVRANWLFGLVRVRYSYPEPGELTAKALWFSLMDSAGEKPEKNKKRKKKKNAKKSREKKPEGQEENASESARTAEAGRPGSAQIEETGAQTTEETSRSGSARSEEISQSDSGQSEEVSRSDNTRTGETPEEDTAAETEQEEPGAGQEQEPAAEETQPQQKQSFFEKIKCTIREICGKIKQARENIEFYKEILLCEDTKGLVNHGFTRLGRILKAIRPRRLKADIHFGTGSPDTTGYALGVYGMLSPYLGRHVNIKPNFEQAVLEGEITARGHITVFHLLWHGLLLILDKRLRQLMKKLKSKDAPDEQKTVQRKKRGK